MARSISAADFPATFAGRLVRPADADYDDIRQLHNGFVDKRPSLIARCRGVADIVDAVRMAVTTETPIAIRGGGHNVSGRASIEGGLMIDLSLMKGIDVDPRGRTVRAQGGVTWGDFNRETQLHGLATTGGVVSSTGIGGLTLGGGFGWLLGTCGLVVDSVRTATIVTADGSVRTASADENADLYWAIRGGGGNFGIAASLEYQLHPVGPMVHGGIVAHPMSAAEDLLRFYRDFTATVADDLTVFFAFVHAPDGSGAKLAALAACYSGAAERADAALAPLKSFGTPVLDALGPIPYCGINSMLDASLPRGARNYWKSTFLSGLTDDAIRAFVDGFATVPSAMSQVIIEHFHGAACRVDPTATAFPHRMVGYNTVIVSQWPDAAADERNMKWTRDQFAALRPFQGSGRYGNYLDHDDTGDAAAAAYCVNYPRLQQIKAKYDPNNVFRQNLNIVPVSDATDQRRPIDAPGTRPAANPI
jgi:FAD/FMN-containing dehydrogenase